MPTTNISSIQAGGGGDYTTIAAWEAATDDNLVLSDTIEIGRIDEAGDYDSGSTITIAGATTDQTRYRKLTAGDALWHKGVDTATGTVHLIQDHTNRLLDLREDYFWVDRLLLKQTTGASSNIVAFSANVVGLLFTDIIASGDVSISNTTFITVAEAAGTGSVAISNALISDFERAGIYCPWHNAGDINGQTYTINIDHSIFDNCNQSGDTVGGNVRIRGGNCSDGTSAITANLYNSVFTRGTEENVTLENGGSDPGTLTKGGSHNACDDTTLTSVGIATSAQESLTAADIYTDLAGDNYLPTGALLGNGTDRQGSEPDARQDFSTDIRGEVRSTTDVAIGAYAVASASGAGGPTNVMLTGAG